MKRYCNKVTDGKICRVIVCNIFHASNRRVAHPHLVSSNHPPTNNTPLSLSTLLAMLPDKIFPTNQSTSFNCRNSHDTGRRGAMPTGNFRLLFELGQISMIKIWALFEEVLMKVSFEAVLTPSIQLELLPVIYVHCTHAVPQ